MSFAFLILLLALAIHHNERKRTKYEMTESTRRARLHFMLKNLRSECLSGKLDQAGNTMMDVRQEWPSQYQSKQHTINYFPPDSLEKLDSLVKQLPVDLENRQTIQLLLRELKYVDEKLDRIPE